MTGSITVAGTSANNPAISIALIPKLLLWRLKKLRANWRSQDFPVDVYSPDYTPASDQLPVVDPDVIGPDDFRRPDPAQPFFALWKTRRVWIDQRLDALASLTKTVVVGSTSVTVPDVNQVLASMYSPVTYGAASMTPWLDCDACFAVRFNCWCA
ncbi:MAG: hypothetical protein ACXW1Z_20815 [Methylobacter sp.]